MLVYLHQYREDDATETVRSGDAVGPDTSASEYFDVDDLETDEWERVEVDGRVLQRRAVDYDEVVAVSVPHDNDEDEEDGDDPDLPGSTLQLRMGGGTEYVENAVLVEAQDNDP
ncbi:hypothetical protein ACFQE8_15235 [Salinirubellus sp. GCM10025818]|jgi:hypothetical protein|uniref:hypothetical protein n=1 Tax=Salinirubellus TaxID=2162630 RepID=UPI0030CC0A19